MHLILRYLRNYKKECIIAPLFKLMEVVFELLVPYVVIRIVDESIPTGDRGLLVRSFLLLLALSLIGFSCTLIAQYFSANAAARATGDIRKDLFGHIQSLSYSQLDKTGTAQLMNRMSVDANSVSQGINMGLRLLLRSPFVVFGAMVMAFTVDRKAAMLFVIMIPILTVIVFTVILAGRPLYARVQKLQDSLLLLTRENLAGVRVLRAFRREEDEKRGFTGNSSALRRAQLAVGRLNSVLNPATVVVVDVFICILIYRGAVSVGSGSLTKGQVIALYNYMSQILVELVKLANLIVTLIKAATAADRIEAVMDTAVEPNGTVKERSDTDTAVEFRNVSFSFGGSGKKVLEDVSFSLRKGEKLGIIGSMGSGKTSLINLIPCNYEPTEGQVLFFGKDVREWDRTELRKQISVIPQRSALLSGTVRSNLLWGNEAADDGRLKEAVTAASAEELISERRGGLDAKVEQNGRNLSGGQKQRLCIARALLKEAPVLIFDDSFSALDLATDARIRKNISSLAWDPAVITVSQRISSIKNSDRIIVLDNGAVAGIGTHEELLAGCPVYIEIAESQSVSGKEEEA
ncbi:MAG: ABC transporter ATP-binding protein [Oscillospiraceae bacterium]|nr:ABC transporter ATP-binding protein [Oscillospiraceae bacterium]